MKPMENPNDFNPEEMIEGLEFENKGLQNQNLELKGALTSAGMQPQDDQNLISYQLETDKILERVEHFLRGDQIKFQKIGNIVNSYYAEPTKNVLCSVKKDAKTGFRYFFQELKEGEGTEVTKNALVKVENKKGEEVLLNDTDGRLISRRLEEGKIKLRNEGYKYTETIDEEKKPFNEEGVAELMRIMSMYITKETILSYYNEERINEILGDLGDAINNFLHCTFEKIGMDTKFKESKYILICLNLLHVVESCYRRALGGAEQENIRTRAIVTQNQGMGGNIAVRPSSIKRKWNPLKPSTW